jgi:hypothetical protein
MTIKFICEKCQHYYELSNELAGKESRCKCGHILFIPNAPREIPLVAQGTGSGAIQNPLPPASNTPPTPQPLSVGDVYTANPVTSNPNGNLLSNLQPTENNINITSPVYPTSQNGGAERTTSKSKLIAIVASILSLAVIVVGIAMFFLIDSNDNTISSSPVTEPSVATDPSQNESNSLTSGDQEYRSPDTDSSVEYPNSSDGDNENINNPFDNGVTPPNDLPNPFDNDDRSTPPSIDPLPTPRLPPDPEPMPVPVTPEAPQPKVASDVYDSVPKLKFPLPKYIGEEAGEIRTWKSVDEKYSVTGTFNGLKQGFGDVMVTIETSDDLVSIPLPQLSIADRNWVYKHGQYDYMRHITGVHKNKVNDFRRYTPSDYDTPTPFDVDWVTDMPELWGPVSTVDLTRDKKELSQGKYNQRYIKLNRGFLEPRDYWHLTSDGEGWLSSFNQGSEKIVLAWNKEFVDAKLGGYTAQTLQKICIEILADRYPEIFVAIVNQYGALDAVTFFQKVIPVFFETSVTGKLVGNVLYAKSFTLKVRNVFGGVHIGADDEVGYQKVFYKELMEWLVKVRARVADGTDLDGDGTVLSTEHAMGYFEEIEKEGVHIGDYVNHLRSLASLGDLNRKMNKFTRMVVQFKKVDQNNDDRIKPDDYGDSLFATHLNIETVKEGFTLKEDERAILLVLLTAGVRPKFYVHFADKFGPAMLSLSFSVRSKEATDTKNPYKAQMSGGVDAMIHSKSRNQAAFADAVFDLIVRKELDHFRYFVKPYPVNGVLQYSDLKESHFLGVYRDQITELGWLTAHIHLLDSKLVDIIPLNVGPNALPSGNGHIYRYAGPQGTLNIWVDGLLERNYAVRGIFWDHSVSESMDTHLWTWKEDDIEYDIRGRLVNVQFIGDKIMMVVEAENGEVSAIPIYRMPPEMRRFARWALAFFRTDRFYVAHDRHDKLPFSLESSTGRTASGVLVEADRKWGNNNGAASRLEITTFFYYDTGRTVQFDAKEATQTGVQVSAVRDLPSTIVTADPFLSGLIEYKTEISTPETEQIYREIPGMRPTEGNNDNIPM